MDAAPESLIVAREARGRAAGIAARRRADAACADGMSLSDARGRLVAAIADGASSSDPDGISPGQILAHVPSPELLADPEAASAALMDADLALAASGRDAQASAVILAVDGGSAYGTSAGDCEAWFVPRDGSEPYQLTQGQNRRPRVGDTVVPVEFSLPLIGGGRIVAATDGLWVNAPRRDVFDIALEGGTAEAAERLVGHVFRRKGGLPDDIALVVIDV